TTRCFYKHAAPNGAITPRTDLTILSQPRAVRPSAAHGFTLIELVISSSLMTLILVSAYMCLSSGVSSRKLIESRAEVVQSARVALAIMSADLRGACPISKDIAFLGMQRMLGDMEADH